MIRDLIPARARRVIYSVLGTVYALELVFDLVPAGAESKILAALAVLGFGLAAGNVTPSLATEPLNDGDDDDQ